MKTYLLTLSVIVILASCKSAAWFETPNDLENINGTLYLSNGEELTGKLSVDEGWYGLVRINVPGEKKARRFKFYDVKGYKLRNDYYEVKEIRDGGWFSRSYHLQFMKRLTPADSKIHLYEYLEKETSHSGYRNRTTTSLEKNYYIQLPSEQGDGVWNIASSKLVPNFDEKMSRIVSDCPALARKIANKEKGYFYSQMGPSDEQRMDIVWNIIEEYNRCSR